MNKIIFIVSFLILVALFIYPSFERLPESERGGVDCIAGCVMYTEKGFPLSYYRLETHGSGIIDSSKAEPTKNLNYTNLFINTLIVFVMSYLIAKIISSLQSRFSQTGT